MRAESVEQLQVWQSALRFVAAVSATARSGPLSRDVPLREQIDGCADSLLANLSEGFEQGTDRGFARYLYIARGSCAEMRAHLVVAHARGHITADAVASLDADAIQIGRMLTGLINYLLRSDRKRRR